MTGSDWSSSNLKDKTKQLQWQPPQNILTLDRLHISYKFLIYVILKKRFRESWKGGVSNGKADRFLTTSMLPGATIIKGGKRPGVLAAACLNFIKHLTIVCRLWPACNLFQADTFQLIISAVLMWSSLFNFFPVKQDGFKRQRCTSLSNCRSPWGGFSELLCWQRPMEEEIQRSFLLSSPRSSIESPRLYFRLSCQSLSL